MEYYSSKFSVKKNMDFLSKQIKHSISSEDINVLKKKGKLQDIDMYLLKTVLLKNYLTIKQIEGYVKLQNKECDNLKVKVKALVSYGLLCEECFSYGVDDEVKETFHYYRATKSLVTFLNKECSFSENEKKDISIYLKSLNMGRRDKIIRILEILSRNEFDLKYLNRYKRKTVLSCTNYNMVDKTLPLFYKIKSEHYKAGMVRVGVISVRNDIGSMKECIQTLERAAKHIFSTENAYPWFVVVCEDERMARKFWNEYLKELVLDNYVRVYFTKDSYIADENIDVFDNLFVIEGDACIYRKVEM